MDDEDYKHEKIMNGRNMGNNDMYAHWIFGILGFLAFCFTLFTVCSFSFNKIINF